MPQRLAACGPKPRAGSAAWFKARYRYEMAASYLAPAPVGAQVLLFALSALFIEDLL